MQISNIVDTKTLEVKNTLHIERRDLSIKGTSVQYLLKSVEQIHVIVAPAEYIDWLLIWLDDQYEEYAPKWCAEIQPFIRNKNNGLEVELKFI